MVAVLPLQNLTGDASQDYFSDGLTEELIAQLGNVDPQHLSVIARTSVMRYKNARTPMDEIGHTLGAQYVLEGSVPARRETMCASRHNWCAPPTRRTSGPASTTAGSARSWRCRGIAVRCR